MMWIPEGLKQEARRKQSATRAVHNLDSSSQLRRLLNKSKA